MLAAIKQLLTHNKRTTERTDICVLDVADAIMHELDSTITVRRLSMLTYLTENLYQSINDKPLIDIYDNHWYEDKSLIARNNLLLTACIKTAQTTPSLVSPKQFDVLDITTFNDTKMSYVRYIVDGYGQLNSEELLHHFNICTKYTPLEEREVTP